MNRRLVLAFAAGICAALIGCCLAHRPTPPPLHSFVCVVKVAPGILECTDVTGEQ
jgi:hypothetical protein